MKKVLTIFIFTISICLAANPVKSMLGAEGNEIDFDEGIVPIEYLESTGTQYIDTRIYGGDGTLCEIDICQTRITANECFLGSVDIGNTHRLWLCYSFSRTWYPGYNNWAMSSKISTSGNEWHRISNFIENSRFGYFIDNEKFTIDFAFTRDFHCESPILMFAMGTPEGAKHFAYGRIAMCRIYQLDVLVRDLIPVRIGDEGFMYDLISGELFGNEGTGAFVLGPDL